MDFNEKLSEAIGSGFIVKRIKFSICCAWSYKGVGGMESFRDGVRDVYDALDGYPIKFASHGLDEYAEYDGEGCGKVLLYLSQPWDADLLETHIEKMLQTVDVGRLEFDEVSDEMLVAHLFIDTYAED